MVLLTATGGRAGGHGVGQQQWEILHHTEKILIESDGTKAFYAWDPSADSDELAAAEQALIDNGYEDVADQAWDVDWMRYTAFVYPGGGKSESRFVQSANELDPVR